MNRNAEAEGGLAGYSRARIVTGVSCGLLGALLAVTGARTILAGHEAVFADRLAALHARPVEARKDLLVVAIDDAATRDLPYQSPLSRDLLARILTELDQRGAAVIALDVILDRPSFPDADAALARAMAGARAKVLTGRDPGATLRDLSCRQQASLPRGGSFPTGEASRILPQFSAAAASLVLCPDADGVVRRMGQSPAAAPLLAEAIAEAMGGAGRADARRIPYGLTATGDLPFLVVTAAHLDKLPPEWVQGRAVLVGSAAPYSGDWFVTPLSHSALELPLEDQALDSTERLLPRGRLPGVIIHAYQTLALIDDARGRESPIWLAWVMGLLGGALGVLLAIQPAGWRLRAAAGMLSAFGAWQVCALAAGPVLRAAGLMLPHTPLPVAAVMAGSLVIAAQESRQRRLKQQIRRAFEHYLAPAVVQTLARSPERLDLGASPREISVLFTDMAGFSAFVDTHPPEVVARVVNAYLEMITGQVIAAGGVVDKIVGDAVHALFSAPVEDAGHRSSAILCALSIDAAAESLRSRFRAGLGVELGATRIGVHSGTALVGNFGGPGRFDYTAHGSTINAAARLEQANKTFGGRICISDAARAQTPGVVFREIAEVRLRGLRDPLRVFEPLHATDPRAHTLPRYAEALGLMAREPDVAATMLAELAAQRPGDPILRYQLARLQSGHAAGVVDI